MIFNLVCLAWLFFRVPTVQGAWEQVVGLFRWHWAPEYGIAVMFLAAFASVLFFLDLQLEHAKGESLFSSRGFAIRVATGLALCVLTSLLGANQVSAFLYFQF